MPSNCPSPKWAAMQRLLKWLLWGAGLLVLAALLLFAIGYRNATADPLIVRQQIVLAGLRQPLRVALISDIHYGWPDMRTARLNRIVQQVNAQQPDLILLAGDYMGGKWFDWPRSWLEEALPPLAALKARYGVFAVEGNHESPLWTRRVMERQIAPKLLVGAMADAGPLVVAGFPSAAHVVPGPEHNRLISRLPPGKPALLLMHEPEQMLAVTGRPRPATLALAGHTHGGQIVLPWFGAISERFLGQMMCRRGLCRINGWPTFVTSGLGTSALPLRFGVPPEIVVLTLVPDGPLPAAGHQSDLSVGQPAGRKSGTER